MADLFGAIVDIGKTVAGKITGDEAKTRDNQARVTEAEISGAPQSKLRLWRSALSWLLVICFAFEVVGRAIITTYFPEAWLPPSAMKEIVSLLCGMLGLGL